MRRLHTIGLLLALIGGLLVPLPVTSQQGRGAIIEVNPLGTENLGSLNALRCDTAACTHVTEFLYPWLIGVDPATGQFAPTRDSLALGWEIAPDGLKITFRLRDDLAWSDGEPVTAYDVFFSYLAITSDDIRSPYAARVNAPIAGAAPLDTHTIAFVYHAALCTALDHTRFPVIPAHAFDPDFTPRAASAFVPSEDPLAQFTRWLSAQPDDYFAGMIDPAPERTPPVTAGIFALDRVQPLDYIRLVRDDGTLGFAYIDLPPGRDDVEMFLAGDTNLIVNPPLTRRADIRAADGIQIVESPGLVWEAINLNLADPTEPQDAFAEDGTRLDQGQHPIFGDVRVRRAIQQAIDTDAIIAAALLGNGTVMPANQLPTSWAYDANLGPIAYDPMAAARLLETAGWKDLNNAGIRTCVTCDYAEPGTRLAFDLFYVTTPVNDIVVDLIAQQLRLVGIKVSLGEMSSDSLRNRVSQQRYDAYLAGWSEAYPINPDQTALFASASDVVGGGQNTGSYANPRIDELLAQARGVPGCDYDARADLYHEIQTLLQADQPYIWLFAAHDMIAVQGGVDGFAPYPHAPFWNIETWVITR